MVAQEKQDRLSAMQIFPVLTSKDDQIVILLALVNGNLNWLTIRINFPLFQIRGRCYLNTKRLTIFSRYSWRPETSVG